MELGLHSNVTLKNKQKLNITTDTFHSVDAFSTSEMAIVCQNWVKLDELEQFS